MFMGTTAARPMPAPATLTATPDVLFYGDSTLFNGYVPKAPTGKQAPYIEAVCQNGDNTIDNILRNLNIINNPDGSAKINTTWTPTGFNETIGATCNTTLNIYNSKAKSYSVVATDYYEVQVAQPEPPQELVLSFTSDKAEYIVGEPIYFSIVTTQPLNQPDAWFEYTDVNGNLLYGDAYEFVMVDNGDGTFTYTGQAWYGEPVPAGQYTAQLDVYDAPTGSYITIATTALTITP